MTQDQLNVFQSITLQVALIVAVLVLWFELKAERKKRDDMLEKAGNTLVTLANAQTQLAAQITEQQRLVINLYRDDPRSPVLPTREGGL